jgi:hypothetical protein
VAAVSVETRRDPRVAARCPAEVMFGAGRWIGLTEDLGPGGCRIVARLALRPGEPVTLRLRYGGVGFPLDVVGTVAWTAPRPPWRTGVAFARGQEEDSRRFVRAVLATSPELEVVSASGGIRAPLPRAAHRPTAAILDPRAAHVRALVISARSQVAAGNVDDAVRQLQSALELAPGDQEVLAELTGLGVKVG